MWRWLTLLSLPPFSFPYLCWRRKIEFWENLLMITFSLAASPVLGSLLCCCWAVPGALFFAVQWHSRCTHWTEECASQRQCNREWGWEVCGASPALPTSPGWRQAQHMMSTIRSEALCTFFSSLSVFYWDAVKFLSPWVLFPCAALLLSNCSNTRVQFSSLSSRAWVLDWFVEDKWKEQLQMGFCAIRALNIFPLGCVSDHTSRRDGWAMNLKKI